MKMKQLIFNLLFRRGKDKMPAIVPGSLGKSRGILGKQARLSNVCFVCFQKRKVRRNLVFILQASLPTPKTRHVGL